MKKLKLFPFSKIVSMDKNNKYLYINSTDSFIIWDIRVNKAVKTFENTNINKIKYSEDNKYIFAIGFGYFKLLSRKTFKEILTFYSIGKKDWIVTSPNGRFDATQGAMDKMYYVKDLKTFPLSNEMKKTFYSRLMENQI